MLKKKIENGIEYVLVNDYYVPSIVLEQKEYKYQIRRFGKMKLRYLKDYKKVEYSMLFMEEKLNEYLHEIDEECEQKYDYLMKKMMQEEGINEKLKSEHQLEWIARINNLKNRVDEIIKCEVIYK